jgi:hypothetical protein
LLRALHLDPGSGRRDKATNEEQHHPHNGIGALDHRPLHR